MQNISQLADDVISLYLLELVHALTYENNHFNPLSEMLLEKSLKSPRIVGHGL